MVVLPFRHAQRQQQDGRAPEQPLQARQVPVHIRCAADREYPHEPDQAETGRTDARRKSFRPKPREQQQNAHQRVNKPVPPRLQKRILENPLTRHPRLLDVNLIERGVVVQGRAHHPRIDHPRDRQDQPHQKRRDVSGIRPAENPPHTPHRGQKQNPLVLDPPAPPQEDVPEQHTAVALSRVLGVIRHQPPPDQQQQGEQRLRVKGGCHP